MVIFEIFMYGRLLLLAVIIIPAANALVINDIINMGKTIFSPIQISLYNYIDLYIEGV